MSSLLPPIVAVQKQQLFELFVIVVRPLGAIGRGIQGGLLVVLAGDDLGVHIPLNMLDGEAEIEYFTGFALDGDPAD